MQVPIEFDPAGSVFVVFREKINPSRQIVELHRDGEMILGPNTPPADLPQVTMVDGKVTLLGNQPGTYELKFANGKTASAKISRKTDSIPIPGPWDVSFQPNRGAPDDSEFQNLTDWSKHSIAGIKYFSGTATYHTTFDFDPATSGSTLWELELGDVRVVAEARLNDTDLGIVWKQPFTVDVTKALRPGKNELEIKVTNLWPNRMIGDEQYADDSTTDGTWLKGSLNAWPDWIINKTARPDPRRITFTTFKHYQKDSPLIPSGLLGPVKLQPVQAHPVK